MELLPERLQDTSDFLRKMKEDPSFPKDSIIFSFDIVSLYPSIPQEEAAWVVANFYEKNNGHVQGRLVADFNLTPQYLYLIKEGIDHVLRGTLLILTINTTDNANVQQLEPQYRWLLQRSLSMSA